ncbi:hypothetical protein SAMN04488109_1183 [Chryseolinea serpens]|uniref:Uncharacterized protein n=1 Tax=Chryseolinea serpens TaxID=947013 RepID=A0A1M5LGJ3_9BACT|nr:hypothetical protein [Chryseolinea serpens]SHG63789.1 hypothetical protein SAMN04488109_1183 [Chryseolinea serpens]
MRLARRVFILPLFAFVFSSCDFIKNAFEYTDTTEAFVNCLLHENYDKSLEYMALEHEMAKNTNLDSLKAGLVKFRDVVAGNLGTELRYSLVSTEKKFSTNASENMPPHTTLAFVQLANKERFGVVEVLFDDASKKILNIRTLGAPSAIPNMIPFWAIVLLALTIPAFNIYMIVQIKRSTLNRKWLKYLAVIFLNAPTITYSAVSIVSFKLLYFQFLLGISLYTMGYSGSIVSVGIPLGGLYWLWKLKHQDTPLPSPVPAPEEIPEHTVDEDAINT